MAKPSRGCSTASPAIWCAPASRTPRSTPTLSAQLASIPRTSSSSTTSPRTSPPRATAVGALIWLNVVRIRSRRFASTSLMRVSCRLQGVNHDPPPVQNPPARRLGRPGDGLHSSHALRRLRQPAHPLPHPPTDGRDDGPANLHPDHRRPHRRGL